jgi:hypothetical protein
MSLLWQEAHLFLNRVLPASIAAWSCPNNEVREIEKRRTKLYKSMTFISKVGAKIKAQPFFYQDFKNAYAI